NDSSAGLYVYAFPVTTAGFGTPTPILVQGYSGTDCGNSRELALSPDGSQLFIAAQVTVNSGFGGCFVGGGSGSSPSINGLYRIDTATQQVTQIADPNNLVLNVGGLVVSPDNQMVYVGI